MAFSRFLICDFSSWQLTTVCVGRCVMRMAEYVVLTGLAARAGGAERVDAQVLGFNLDVDLFNLGGARPR